MSKVPKLPQLLKQKLYKTGQTRGADDDEIFQNCVARNSTVLIPYDFWKIASLPPNGDDSFENGYIALISPQKYFLSQSITEELAEHNLKLGQNALIFYETRSDWRNYNPASMNWQPAMRRIEPLGGEYVARVSATTAVDGGEKVILGFTTTSSKGAGIRIYEYASSTTIRKCRLQLEALFWFCVDAVEVASAYGMSVSDVIVRKDYNKEQCERLLLLDLEKLRFERLLSKAGKTMCPLCLEEISAKGFFSRVEQAEGRIVHDITITQLNLFHIEELRIGRYGHRPYNLGWGHHHCNVVVKDAGLDKTLTWMNHVIDKNIQEGHLIPKAKAE